MASFSTLPSLFRSSSLRTLYKIPRPLVSTPAFRTLATKHPKGFVAPTDDELQELRERVQEFTSEYIPAMKLWFKVKSAVANNGTLNAGREIPEDVAARTDTENEFPAEMWKKLGDAGYY